MSNETQTVRTKATDDKTIIAAYQQVATSGESDACMAKAASIAGMKESSFQQRVSKIRIALDKMNEAKLEAYENEVDNYENAMEDYRDACREAEANNTEFPEEPKRPEPPQIFELAEMPRKSGGGRRKKTADDFASVLADVNAELGIS